MKLTRMFFALLLIAFSSRAAQMELLSGGLVSVKAGFESPRVAVDVSSNLVNWMQLTNAASAGSQVTFVNDAQQADPMRFFRVADADQTFAIAGYVDGGEHFGGVAGATITESATGTSVVSDANGFFHFNQRFPISSAPIQLTATATGRGVVQREIRRTEANTFSVLAMPLNGPGFLESTTEQTYH